MKKPTNTPATKRLESHIFSIEVELERLSYFEALFTAIANDKSASKYTANNLAKLGRYLAQDFAHYSESELDDLIKAKGADDE